MKKVDPLTDDDHPGPGSVDLARRLARYRTRVEAEGRKRSLQAIDQAIRDANEGNATDP